MDGNEPTRPSVIFLLFLFLYTVRQSINISRIRMACRPTGKPPPPSRSFSLPLLFYGSIFWMQRHAQKTCTQTQTKNRKKNVIQPESTIFKVVFINLIVIIQQQQSQTPFVFCHVTDTNVCRFLSSWIFSNGETKLERRLCVLLSVRNRLIIQILAPSSPHFHVEKE